METPLLNGVESTGFSYPMNAQFPNSFASSGVQAGFLVAYGSGSRVVVLVGGEHITAVLDGHEDIVCAVTFEMRGQHILSADVSGRVCCWLHGSVSWRKMRETTFKFMPLCLAWYSGRREVCVSSAKGLFRTTVNELGEYKEQLVKKSSFCAYNSDGSMLLSHNRGKMLTVFMMNLHVRVIHVIPHPSHLRAVEMHPNVLEFVTMTSNNVLRIWKWSAVFETFSCTIVVKVGVMGRFVIPAFCFEGKSSDHRRPEELGFLTSENDIETVSVDECGRLLSTTGTMFEAVHPLRDDARLCAVYTTNRGRESVIATNHGVRVIVTQFDDNRVERCCLFHDKDIVDAEFAPKSSWMFSRDEGGLVILWPVFQVGMCEHILGDAISAAAWIDGDALVFLEGHEVKKHTCKKNETTIYDFPRVDDCRKFVFVRDELVVISSNQVVTVTTRREIPRFIDVNVSGVFEGNIMMTFITDDKRLTALVFPALEEVCFEKVQTNLVSAVVISMSTIVSMSSDDVKIWCYANGMFSVVATYDLYGMHSLYADTTGLCGRALLYNDHLLLSIENGVRLLAKSHGIKKVITSDVGNIAVFTGKSFYIHPAWCVRHPQKSREIARLGGAEVSVRSMSEDARFLARAAKATTKNCMIAPRMLIEKRDHLYNIVQATLFHLLEFSRAGSMDNFTVLQVPPIPNQDTISEAMTLSLSCDREDYHALCRKLCAIREDIDMFGLRYLLAVIETPLPPAYFALWLAFSYRQSQIAEYVSHTIDVSSLSKMYIGIGIKSHALLVKIVKAALINQWTTLRNVEPVALLYVALGQTKVLTKLYGMVGDNQRRDYFSADFSTDRRKKSALKNAYSSLSHQNYEMASALFLIAGDIAACIRVVMKDLNDSLMAFLVLRLLGSSNYETREMNEFIQSNPWHDSISPILVAHLTGSESVPDKLRDRILEIGPTKRGATFGDRRLALFEVYHYLTKKTDVVEQLGINLTCDGLAPLAQYLYSLLEVSYTTMRMTKDNRGAHEDDIEEDTAVEDCAFERIMIPRDPSFQFGTWDIDDDDDSELESDESVEQLAHIAEEPELELQEDDQQDVSDNSVFVRFAKFSIHSLSRLYESGSEPNDECGMILARFGGAEEAHSFISAPMMDFVLSHMSIFIDFCWSMFFDSVTGPLAPARLLSMCFDLAKVASGSQKTVNPDLMVASEMLAVNPYVHSFFCGSVAVALWTHSDNFLAQMLSMDFTSASITPERLPPPKTFFDVDIRSPLFPDSVKELLDGYLQARGVVDNAIRRDRLLIMLLLFHRVLTTASNLSQDSSALWCQALVSRYNSMCVTLEYQLAIQGGESIIRPPYLGRTNIARVISDEYVPMAADLRRIETRASAMLPHPAIFKNGYVCVGSGTPYCYPVGYISTLAFVPNGDKTHHCIFGASGFLWEWDITRNVQPERFQEKRGVSLLVAHPTTNVFVAVAGPAGEVYTGCESMDYKFEFENDAVKCASFSPNGRKIAMGTIKGSIGIFEFIADVTEPDFSHCLRGSITAIAWIDAETTLVVGCRVSTGARLIIIDTLTRRYIPVIYPRERGIVTAIATEPVQGLVAIGTSDGVVITFSTKGGIRFISQRHVGSEIASIAILGDLVVAATRSGSIRAGGMNSDQWGWGDDIDSRITSVAIVDEIVLIAGDELTLYRAVSNLLND